MKITDELIESLKTESGSWTKKSLAYLGVEWPPQKGWRRRILGREIHREPPKAAKQLDFLKPGQSVGIVTVGPDYVEDYGLYDYPPWEDGPTEDDLDAQYRTALRDA